MTPTLPYNGLMARILTELGPVELLERLTVYTVHPIPRGAIGCGEEIRLSWHSPRDCSSVFSWPPFIR
jgi:hypothetical protein